MDTSQGSTLWSLEGESQFLAEAHVSPDDKRVYFIQSIDGLVLSLDQKTGETLWRVNCELYTEDCANSVKANFALSEKGDVLYYADVLGRIIALELGTVKLKTVSGGIVSVPPDFQMPTEFGFETEKSKDGASLGGSVALIVLATMVALGSGFYVAVSRRRKSASYSIDPLRSAFDDAATFDGSSEDTPDPYEDSILHQHNDNSREPQSNNWNSDEISPTGSMKSTGSFFGNYPATSRLSTRVAPMQEDFSLGAAVIV